MLTFFTPVGEWDPFSFLKPTGKVMSISHAMPRLVFMLAVSVAFPAATSFAQDDADDESVDFEIRIDEETTKSVTVAIGDTVRDVLSQCRPARPYADDDPWVLYEAADGGAYMIFFDEAGDETSMDDTLCMVAHYPKDEEQGEFLLPSNLKGKACGEYMTLRVPDESIEKGKPISLALLMSVRDVRRLFRGCEDLNDDRDRMLFEAAECGGFLLIFNPQEESPEGETVKLVLTDVVYRYDEPAKTIHLFPRSKRGEDVNEEHLRIFDDAGM